MEKIDSFKVNHLDLLPGIYVSRKDQLGDSFLTTFDIRVTTPNKEPVLNTAETHTIEHLGATFLRNEDIYKKDIIYFGPMGCRTGFYLIIKGDLESKDIIDLVREMFKFISDFEDDIPGATPRDCGNYLDMNLPMAKYIASKFLNNILNGIEEKNLKYPE